MSASYQLELLSTSVPSLHEDRQFENTVSGIGGRRFDQEQMHRLIAYALQTIYMVHIRDMTLVAFLSEYFTPRVAEGYKELSSVSSSREISYCAEDLEDRFQKQLKLKFTNSSENYPLERISLA